MRHYACIDSNDPLIHHPINVAMNHPRQVDWVKNCHGVGSLAVAVMYNEIMDKEERQKVCKYMRGLYDVPCGS